VNVVRTWPVLAILLASAMALPAFAQQGIASATVAGTVVDPSGAVLPGAGVELKNVETGLALRVDADARGRYRLLNVPVGRYELEAAAPGFRNARVELTLGVGDAREVPMQLIVAGGAESIQVSAAAPAIETRRAAIAERVTPAEIEGLPLNGRNYLDLALLTPNVSRTNTRSNERFAETSAVPGTGVSVAGQRNLGNTFIVDGLAANDDAADLAGTAFSEDVIREFQVITSGATAEFGRAPAGVINVVTRSGTNAVQARAYGYFRDARWDAGNPLATRKDPLTQKQYGGSAGGPIIRDRWFWFGNVERTNQEKNGVVTIAPGDIERINAGLTRVGYRAPLLTTGEFITGYAATNVFGRVDFSGNSSRLALRYNGYTVDSPNARGVGGLNAVSRGTPQNDTDHTVALGWQIARSDWLNEIRGQGTSSRLEAPATDQVGPAVAISGVANFGTSSSSPTRRDLTLFELADTATLQRGGHLMKAGLDFIDNRVTIDFPGATAGSYSFTSLANFERGAYQQYQQAFGNVTIGQHNPNLAMFAQDEWTLSNGFTLVGGLRYDLQWLPAPIALDADNVAPRLGVTWRTPGGSTVIRATGGVYFDRIPLRATSNALQRDGVNYQTAVLSFGQPEAPSFPAVLPAYPFSVLTAVTTIDPHVQSGRSVQAAVQVEHALAAVVASAAYTYLRGRGILMQRNTNVPTLTAAQAAVAGIANLGRPDPKFGNISRYESIGDSWFDGLTFGLTTRVQRVARVRASYTLSRALDTSGNAFFSTPQNNFDIAAEKGPSDNDQRHRLSLSGSIGGTGTALNRPLAGIEVAFVMAAATGVPFNVVAGSDLNNDTTNNDRPPGVSRNNARQPATATLDLRVSRSFPLGTRQRVQVSVDAFNVLDRTNVLAVNNTFGTGATPLATFGRPTLAAEGRELQLGVRWSF
jgi:outer membrane receptor protein involved in Fe transport